MTIQFRNPCKVCLIRPICKQRATCEPYYLHGVFRNQLAEVLMVASFLVHIAMFIGGWFFVTRIWPCMEPNMLNTIVYVLIGALASLLSYYFVSSFIWEIYSRSIPVSGRLYRT
jgi:hypothetical protein